MKISQSEADSIANSQAPVVVEELLQRLNNEIQKIDFNILLSQIRNKIDEVITNYNIYEKKANRIGSTKGKVSAQARLLSLQRDLVYDRFFELQNLMNQFIKQKIVLTYVHVDPITGLREIRLYDNTIQGAAVTINSYYGREYAKLAYTWGNHYQMLQNALPKEDNEGLQNTAQEVERRYEKYRGKILWLHNNEWQGYRLYNRGPINESFVGFFVNNIKFNSGLQENIYQFMASAPHGVIYVDNANGYLLGDTNYGGIQFAVKGAFGGPQNFKKVIVELKKLQNNFSEASFQEFVNTFSNEEREKAKSISTQLSSRSISGMIRYHGEEILKNLTISK